MLRSSLRAIVLSLAWSTAAQQGPVVVEHVAFAAAPDDGFALLLPPGFDRSQRWPLLMVFDPRGRAVEALELFKPAAESLGWMVLATEGTRSDGPWDPNEAALAALELELQRLPVDPDRMVAAGFSGGAAVAWRAEQRFGGLLGLILVGGRSVPEVIPDRLEDAVFVVAGEADFNYWPSRELADLAEGRGAIARFESFPGGHEWLDAELAEVALRWIEIVAMERGALPVDPAAVTSAVERELRLALSAYDAGSLVEAEHRLQLAEQIDGSKPEIETLRERLDKDPRLRVQHRAERRARRFEELALVRMRTVAEALDGDERVSTSRLEVRLGLGDLIEMRQRKDASGAAARRVEAAAMAQLSFYSLRSLRQREAWDRAAVALELALGLRPESPRLWLELASVHASGGDHDKARTALAEARRLGLGDDAVTQRPELEALLQ